MSPLTESQCMTLRQIDGAMFGVLALDVPFGDAVALEAKGLVQRRIIGGVTHLTITDAGQDALRKAGLL